ncbi:DUF1007 family protein [Rhizobiaceae bacterium BDR2-2]|uniref:DUF1007 family protein n=1 Tax=Ectorhizobium quercum TaxID=2965071 RepID=A0AAE3N140_9HYPH|nr:DUF1007 family protein [Ectorhizobium quercum]MCX8996872.1 DUF1007 family protein [Ectorhizobium quercum]
MKKALFLALAVAFPSLAHAHPHVFAEARLEAISDDQGNISELRNVWRFDEVFSSSVLMDFDSNRNLKLDPDEAAVVGQTVKDSLAEYGYYMNIAADGKEVKITPPDVINVLYQDGKLLMFFILKPEEPLPVKGRITLGVWDPTFYTSIDFVHDEDMATEGKAVSACKRTVLRPDPDEVLAQNQDKLTAAFFDDPAGTNMSKLFAVQLELSC